MSYYNHFDEATNQGRVFDSDLSLLQDLPAHHLTETEIAERDAWRTKMLGVYSHYEDIDPPRVSTTECLLQQRVMVPNLASTSVSSRSQLKESRRGRRYPDTLLAWREFQPIVEDFHPAHRALKPRQSDIFGFSSSLTNNKMSLSDEKEEENYILMVLKKSLMMADLVGSITTRGGIGKPDALTLKTNIDTGLPSPDDIGLVAEFKSTHNLSMPVSADAVAAAYNQAYHTLITERGGQSSMWARVCHPIGQVLGYMADNGRRCGVLSSATRSYFLAIQSNGHDARVYISNAFLVGQPNFLRAWAYAHSLSCEQLEPLVANKLTWKLTSKDHPTPPPKNKYKGSLRAHDRIYEGNEGQQTYSADIHTKSSAPEDMIGLKEISIDDVEIIGTLGYGHNGVVYAAKWGGKKVALKQFDVGKDGYEYYDKEIAAYVALKDAWGELVATPFFVAESWSGWVKFIGLQLGRDPGPTDDISQWRNVLSTLEAQYGFRHDDAENGNMVFVVDEATGVEKLVAIDLEANTMTPRIASP
ncbi:hypothetical protein IV203_031022 [Nitzschia inconspicua]|uniref:Protein kinase domain-containing protein n=1 Tax=Nitzschia inconspicua TaxID=303405 RepID=A0A9K3Q4R2_9STRA|nr:hypothetical protein IV203_031022 [Nitzschia inconspicua]